MGILNRLKDALHEPSIDDADLYADIAREIDSGNLRPGIWAKALAEADFDEKKGRALYMRMAVRARQQEISAEMKCENLRQQTEMNQAYALFNEGKFSEALDGLLLLIEVNKSPVAMGCLASISFKGLAGPERGREFAMKLLKEATKSMNIEERFFLGTILENLDGSPEVLEMAFDSLRFSAERGHVAARPRWRALESRMVSQGLRLP